MKMKTFLIIITAGFLALSACSARQEDTCETDRIDGDWKAVSENDNCSNAERAEAYLARAGFNYFEFIVNDDPDLIEILGLSENNWLEKKDYFDNAIDLIGDVTDDSRGTDKTISLLGSYLALFTHVSGNLDNGAGSAAAFDGEIEEAEQSHFTGSALSSSDADASELIPTDFYQIRIVGQTQYYVVDGGSLSSGPPYSVFLDNNGDGSGDERADNSTGLSVISSMLDPGLAELNQVTHMNSLQDPFADSAGLNISAVNTFADDILQYILKIQTATEALNVDASQDAVKQVEEFRQTLDNGGVCSELEDNPAILLVQYFASSLQEDITSDYSLLNRLVASRINEYGVDASFDTIGLLDTYSIEELGVKVRFRVNESSDYISYWTDSSSEIKTTLEVFKNFDNNQLEAGDNKIVFSEVICASDLMSE
jgi:hypothetical protein